MNALPKTRETSNLRLVPPTIESKKVSVDDGFTAIPNELLESILKSGVLGWKGSYLLATILKTLKWHKESDWFSHSQVCEMMEIEPTKYHINQLSAARKELLRANILFEDGRKTGVNLAVFEWSMVVPDKVGKSRKSSETIPENVGIDYPDKVGNTKETITKQKINNTPLTPQGGEAEVKPDENILADAQSALAYYNELANGSCRDAKPFITLLTKTSSREAYSLDEIKIVVKWVLAVWKRRNGSPPKPKNICTVTRFDGYLSDALSWQKNQALYLDVVDAYNRILGDRLVPMNELDRMAESQIQGLLANLKDPSIDGFTAYFETFAANAKPYYFEPEKKLGFSFLMKPETLYKTRRGEL